MLYIRKIDDYLEIVTDEEVKYVIVINFSEYFKSIEEDLRKVAKLLYFFLTTPDKAQSNYFDNCINHYNFNILNLFDSELQFIDTKLVIKTN